MYEVINTITLKSEGIFSTMAAAEKWIATHGKRTDFVIAEW